MRTDPRQENQPTNSSMLSSAAAAALLIVRMPDKIIVAIIIRFNWKSFLELRGIGSPGAPDPNVALTLCVRGDFFFETLEPSCPTRLHELFL
jgi:hypothetical protein